jgi:hypothetical protein
MSSTSSAPSAGEDPFVAQVALQLSRLLNIVTPNELLAHRVIAIGQDSTLASFEKGEPHSCLSSQAKSRRLRARGDRCPNVHGSRTQTLANTSPPLSPLFLPLSFFFSRSLPIDTACAAFGKFPPGSLSTLHTEILTRGSQLGGSSASRGGVQPSGFAIHDGDKPDMLEPEPERIGGLVRGQAVSLD